MEIDIPDHVMDSFARTLLPSILKFYESEVIRRLLMNGIKTKTLNTNPKSRPLFPE